MRQNPAGQAITVVATTAAEDWYMLETGAWIAGFLVTDVTTDLPVVDDIPVPLPTATPTSSAP